MILFTCPTCKNSLESAGGALLCFSCSQKWPVEEGVAVFARSEGFYWSEVSREEGKRLVEEAKRQGWHEALVALAGTPEGEKILDAATNEDRTRWIDLLDLPKNAHVLDVGCGWGLGAMVLERQGHTVYAMDLTLERASFLMVRCQQEAVSSVIPFCAGDELPLPLHSESMDAVVFNGVLEWTPTSSVGNPRLVQRKWLTEAHRLLGAGGQLYVGIENRFALFYFFGVPEPHAKLPYVSLLPRWAADYYARRKGHEGYRTYTYTHRGYGRLLREAGFRDVKFFWPFPDYRHITEMISLEDRQRLRQLVAPSLFKGKNSRKTFRDRVKSWLVGWGLYSYLVPCYGIVATKGPSGVRKF